jgi:hypothetical protein
MYKQEDCRVQYTNAAKLFHTRNFSDFSAARKDGVLGRLLVGSTTTQRQQRGRQEEVELSDITAWITDDVTTTTKTTTATIRTTATTTTQTTTGCRRYRQPLPLGSEMSADPLKVDVIDDDVIAIAAPRLNVRRFERNDRRTRRRRRQ